MILGEQTQGRPEPAAATLAAACRPRTGPARRHSATGEVRVTLIIGGGIAAYKSLDLIRRLKERHIRVRCVLTKAAAQFVTPLAASALSRRARLYRPVRSRERIRCRPYPAGARLRPDRGGAGDRRSDGEDGAGPRRRSRQRHPARGQPADPAGAGDEPDDVEQCRDPPQRRAARARRRRVRRAQRRRDGGGRRGRRRPHGGADRNRGRRRALAAAAAAAAARRQARADHRRAHA